MGETVLTFKRYEKKYLLSAEEYERLWERLEEYVEPDGFFRSTVCSIYYDDNTYSLIRNSIEKPKYKEKLRVRSYNVPNKDGRVFVELKKKFEGVVYKRRVVMSAEEAESYLSGEQPAPVDSQMVREIDWFMHENKPIPKVFIACEREAYKAKENENLRITFDRNIRWRETDLHLTSGSYGEELLEDGQVLMEIKIPGAAPLWLAEMLSQLQIYPRSFSKYGTCYKNNLVEKYFNEVICDAQ